MTDAERGRRWRAQNQEHTREWNRLWRERNREKIRANNLERKRVFREYVTECKRGRPCADCGGVFDPVCMDFDHRPGEVKRAEISNLRRDTYSLRVLSEEIAKCDLVCANCHRLRTHRRLTEAREDRPEPPQLSIEALLK